jgi:hypothetical protein
MMMSEEKPAISKVSFNMVAIVGTLASLATATHQYQRAEQAEQIAQQRYRNIQEEVKREVVGLQQQKIQNSFAKAEFDVYRIRNADLANKNIQANEKIKKLDLQEKSLNFQIKNIDENLKKKSAQLTNNELAIIQTNKCIPEVSKLLAEISTKTELKNSDKSKMNELSLCFSQGYTKKVEVSASDAATERNSKPSTKVISDEKKALIDEQIRLANNLKPTVFIHIESGSQQLENDAIEIRKHLLESGYIVPSVQTLDKAKMPKSTNQIRFVYREEKQKAADLEAKLKLVKSTLFEQNKFLVTPPMERYRYDVAPNVLELWLIVV